MNPRRTKITATLATILVVGGFVLMPHEAHAWSFLPNTDGIIDSVLTFLFNNILLPLANMFVQLTGFLLNATMTITLNMSTLVSSSGGIIDSTWSIIRDISSILIIFFLLYTAIEIIIGQNDSKVQHLVVMVAIAGVLINFSLFFTKIAVDASNLVSLAFYRAITPTGSAQWDGTGAYLTSAINDGGLSNVFMNALQLQTFYSPASGAGLLSTSTASALTGPNPIAVIAAGAGGVAVMFIAGLSFLAASILFVVRIGFLILLMAFSPVFFLGMIIPKFKEKISDRWKDALISQCLIMPVYMLFMYVAMRVITNPNFKNILDPSTVAANANSSLPALMITPGTVGAVMQYVIAIFLISIPLFAAMTYASFGKEWAKGASDWTKGKIKQGVQKSWQGAYQGTVGRAASKIATSERFKDFASNNVLGEMALKGTRGVAQGYNKKLEEQVKSRTEFAESLGVNQHALNEAQEQLRRFNNVKNTRGRTLTTANKAILDQQIRDTESKITDINNARKSGYAGRINSKSIDTLFTKVARKDKVAAAKLQTPIFEAKVKEYDKNVADVGKKLGELNDKKDNNDDKITNIQEKINQVRAQILPGAMPTPAQGNQLNTLNRQMLDAVDNERKITEQINAATINKTNLDTQRATIDGLRDQLNKAKETH